ncbi:ABC transporter ATP-binding protein/permease [Clostridium manihotivorum]|uniref:ABC transmembrane type-1 domain-containing protein n=1 Tax=Clostridium manihotivorum TaxID=2320868 RepID=A0A410DVJ3_9CLOT|nr:ABC transporter ATP-binding protein/permease [Clostridium manihotivorum]QAA33136.1 hypothetical protein C1I91_16660 [Clostridium manihotivorum]
MHKDKLKKNGAMLKFGIKEIFNLQPWVIPVTILEAFFKASFPFINIYMSAKIIDQLTGAKDKNKLFTLVIVTICLNLLVHLISTILEHLARELKGAIEDNQKMRLDEKILNMSYKNIENPETYILRTKITEATKLNGGGIIFLMNELGEIEKGIFTLITSIAMVISLFNEKILGDRNVSFINSSLFTYSFFILIIISVLISINFQSKANKVFFNSFSRIIVMNRFFSYYFNQILDYNVGKEIRLYNEKKLILKEMDSFSTNSQNLFNELGSKNAKYSGADGLISSLVSGAVYLFIGFKAIIGAITIGSIVQYIGSIKQFMDGSGQFLRSLGSILNNNQYIEIYKEFLELENTNVKGSLPVEKRDDNEYEIEFRNVSFKYPGSKIMCLKTYP